MLPVIEQWLQGVKNAAHEFNPTIYRTDAVPTKEELTTALQMLSRLSKYNGFIPSTEEMYTQIAEYSMEHFNALTLNEAQCVAARDAITNSLSAYYDYDPTIGNDIHFQMKCFLQTLREIDKAIAKPRPIKIPLIPRAEKQILKITQPVSPAAPKQNTVNIQYNPQIQQAEHTLHDLMEDYGEYDIVDDFNEVYDESLPTAVPPSTPKPAASSTPPATGFVPTSSMLEDLLSDVDFD